MTATGRSLHISVPAPNFSFKGSRFPALPGLENDVKLFRYMAKVRGFTEMPSPKPSVEFIQKAIVSAAAMTKSDDLLFLTMSGHGFQVRDRNNDEPGEDRLDEAFACEDDYLLDDDVHRILAQLPLGARVVLLVDACHSATMHFVEAPYVAPLTPPEPRRIDGLLASVLCLAACGDGEQAELEVGLGSQLAMALQGLYFERNFQGSYADLWRYARTSMAYARTALPRWTSAGPDDPHAPLAEQAVLSLARERARV